MQRVQFVSNDEKDWWGFGFETWKADGIRVFGHSGGFQGYITRIGIDPQNEIGMVVLTNAIDAVTLPLWNGMYHTLHYFLHNLDTLKPIKKKLRLKKYEGLFSSNWGDVEIIEIHHSLNYFYPESEQPMGSVCRLEYETKNICRIVSATGFDYVGEKIRFQFNRSNKLMKIYHGPIPCVPFRSFKM